MSRNSQHAQIHTQQIQFDYIAFIDRVIDAIQWDCAGLRKRWMSSAVVVVQLRTINRHLPVSEQPWDALIMVIVQMSQDNCTERKAPIIQDFDHRLRLSWIDDDSQSPIMNHPNIVVFERKDGLNAHTVHDYTPSNRRAKIIWASHPPMNASVRSHGTLAV